MEDTAYVLPAAVTGRSDRQMSRYTLRSSLRKVTTLKRLRACGLPFGGDMKVRTNCGVHHFSAPIVRREGRIISGMSTCGSGWACPVCSAKIRYHRATEVSRAVVEAMRQNMGALFITRTIPHTAAHHLRSTLRLVGEGRRYVFNQTVIKQLRREAGYVGGIASKETTYGRNGWHPHTHDIEFFDKSMTLETYVALGTHYYDYLDRFYTMYGFPGLSRSHGVKVEDVQLDSGALAHYVTKLQESDQFTLPAASEMTRTDLKHGRDGALLPFDLAATFFTTGDMDMLNLWHEYEQETFGRSVIRFTPGLRALLLPGDKELTDEQAAAAEVGGTDVVRFEGWFYRRIAAVPGLEGKVLYALDTGGFAALVELLVTYELDSIGGYSEVTHG